MNIIVISSPENVAGETAIISAMFESGLQFFHLRKPEMNGAELEKFIQEVPEIYHDRIVMHSCYNLVSKYRLQGYHFNKESFHLASEKEILPQRHKSFSFHSFLEVEEGRKEFSYAFLSPIFNSISKDNYKSCFDFDELKEFLKTNRNMIALGGGDEDKVEKVHELGFDGMAVLGAIWNSKEPVQKFIRLKTVCNALKTYPLTLDIKL